MLKILIVEDEKNLGNTLEEYLKSIGHDCKWATDGEMTRSLFKSFNPQIVLMDIGLPDCSGLELAKELRKDNKNFNLLFLSALNDPEIKVEALDIGGEDYITKPFALKELIFRLDKILNAKNQTLQFPEEIVHGKLKIWFRRFEVQDALGNILNLSQKECAILELLYKRKNEAINRDEIIDKIWGTDKFPSNRTVDNYIVKLRKWSESDLEKNIEISSIRGIGYKLILKQ
jgi:two-component system alkaline phosphatase synthesis response regulator PhoP